MTDEATTPVADAEVFDQSLLDPSSWKEPVEIVPVEIVSCKVKKSSPEYNKAYGNKGMRPELPRSIWQLEFNLKRLDAQFDLPDGSTAPVTLYAGVDLERYAKNRQGSYEFSSALIKGGRGKATKVITAWTKAIGGTPLSAPGVAEKLVGQKWLVKWYKSLQVGDTEFAMTNVALPETPLLPDYKYDGEVLHFKPRADNGASAEGGEGVSAEAFTQTEQVDPQTAAERIGEFVRANGITVLDSTVLANPAFPAGCLIEPFVGAFVAGDAQAREVLGGYGVEVA